MSVRVLLLTNEYPPHVYGGAGVHVDYLSRELAKLGPVDVRCFGQQREDREGLRVQGFSAHDAAYTCPKHLRSIFAAAERCVAFNAEAVEAQVVHCHTWYTHLGGLLAKLNYGLPLIITVHSLEPLRPWKREQLGGGYDFSCWVERQALEMADAVIAVSAETRNDVRRLFKVPEERLHIIHNGIDPDEYRPVDPAPVLQRFGIDGTRPYVLFVGRITRQKGIVYFVKALQHLRPDCQVVLCAGAPDTPEIAAEMKAAVAEASRQRPGIIWIEEMVDRPSLIQLYSGAAVFCCPSIYEPFGIINLEAMACEVPVVATRVGGIPEVVAHGETGFLVPLEQQQDSPFLPLDPAQFAYDLAQPLNRLLADDSMRQRFAKAGRRRALEKFSWKAIAAQTHDLYRQLVAHGR